jgi:hypothetical protein
MYGHLNRTLQTGFGGSVPPTPWLMPYSDADNGNVEAAFRADYEDYEKTHGLPTWMHLIREEVAELFNSHISSDMIEEAVQVAALCVSLCEQLLAKYEGDNTGMSLRINDSNRLLIYRAYDDGDGNTVSLVPSEHEGWFVGVYDGHEVMYGTEINGTLYSVCPSSGNGVVSVLVGTALVENSLGRVFSSVAEAREHVQGLRQK